MYKDMHQIAIIIILIDQHKRQEENRNLPARAETFSKIFSKGTFKPLVCSSFFAVRMLALNALFTSLMPFYKECLCHGEIPPEESRIFCTCVSTCEEVKSCGRNSTEVQNIDFRIDALYAFGCKKVFYDRKNGIKIERP